VVSVEIDDRRIEPLEDTGAPREAGAIEVGSWLRQRFPGRILRAQRAEDRRHIVRVAEPILRALFQELKDEAIELIGDRGDPGGWRLRLLVEVLIEDRAALRAGEGRSASDGLIEDAAESVEIGPGIHELPPDLLGRHIGVGTHDLAGRLELLTSPRAAELRCDPEVHEHRLLVGLDEDVLWLEISVDDAVAMEKRERRADAKKERERLREGDRVKAQR
jgi:hypothetical protein